MTWLVVVMGLAVAAAPVALFAEPVAVFARISPLGDLEVSREQQYPGWSRFVAASNIHGGGPPFRSRAPGRFHWHIARAAAHARVDERLVHAVVSVESSYNAQARSPRGAQGLMQIMPATAKAYRPGNLLDPEENLRVGTLHLASLLQRFNGDVRMSVAAYHAGEGAVRRHSGIPPFPDTVAYVGAVLARYRSAPSTLVPDHP